MTENRRDFLRLAAAGAALAAMPPSIARALAIPATRTTGTIKDVKHVVILMQENRSFDHYFGTMRGVRGFADRHPVPMPGGRAVWQQSDGTRELPPFHLDTVRTNALKVPGTPHSYADAQAAWNQGNFGQWPLYKTPYSMGHFRREDIPFQFALAEAFTICDAYHCSVTSGTDPNRVVFWSGSSADPGRRAGGINCTDEHSEPNNWRCWIKGALPEPGYSYAGNALTWPTLPDVLEAAGIDWRIYQDPNDNWTGAMHGGLAFESFRNARPGSPLYERGMRHWSLERLAQDARDGTLPQVSWVLPPMNWSEHPSASTPLEGGAFTARVLDALTANPETWASTVFFQTFDENDGQFDHVPPPAPPSYAHDGRMAGAATLPLDGHYFSDPAGKYTDKRDAVTGNVRPFGLGPRVPMYVVSPWSKGGWVSSETFDHTSVGRFLEARFGVTIPGISPWHRAVCGDLTSAFDFAAPADPGFPALPEIEDAPGMVRIHLQKPKAMPPEAAEALFQEPGVRPSRALPYVLHADIQASPTAGFVRLSFRNEGKAGAVFQVYDRLALDRLPRRYTVEAGKSLSADWSGNKGGTYDLWILGPAGWLRHYRGRVDAAPKILARYDTTARALRLQAAGRSRATIRSTVYAPAMEQMIAGTGSHAIPVGAAANWYDVTIAGDGFEQRYAGRIEDGHPHTSDPA
jgi:phospholipase C